MKETRKPRKPLFVAPSPDQFWRPRFEGLLLAIVLIVVVIALTECGVL